MSKEAFARRIFRRGKECRSLERLDIFAKSLDVKAVPQRLKHHRTDP
jgi:hypothetical protein